MRGLLILILVLAVQSLALANEPPVANAGPDQSTYTGQQVILYGSATDPNGNPILAWLWSVQQAPAGATWELSDASSYTSMFTGYLAGDYLLWLSVYSASGFSAPDPVYVHVADNLPPVAVATADKTTITVGETVCFDGSQSYDPEGGPLTYTWALGDGTYVDAVTACHAYSSTDTFNVGLRVADERGATNFDYIAITVQPPNLPPEASPTATPNSGDAPLTVQFAANAFDPDEDPLTYAWNFGDPLSADNNSTLENPTHIFHQKGIYRVTVDVSDGLATITRSITIRVGRYGIDYLLGDIDFDGDVDFADFIEFTVAYLTETGDPDYNSDADLAPNDGFIDLCDFALFANDWGKVLP